MALGAPNVDIRPLLIQIKEREAQHHGHRLTPDQLCETLAVDSKLLSPLLTHNIILVDDVITMGASFAASKRLLMGLPEVKTVTGLFLAKTVRPAPEFSPLTPEQIQQIFANGKAGRI